MKDKNYIRNNFDSLIWKPVKYILIGSFVVFLLDYFDIPSRVELVQKLTNKYDWFSLIGALSSGLVSVYFLIVVTRMDREDNNEIVRQSKRPYLNTDFKIFNNKQIDCISNDMYLNSNMLEEDIVIPTVRITNVGETGAIIDVQKSYVNIEYEFIESIKDGKEQRIKKSKKMSFNDIVKRLAVSANSIIYVGFDANEVLIPVLIPEINITECYIEYKDLFDVKYVDHIQIEGGHINILSDNEEVCT